MLIYRYDTLIGIWMGSLWVLVSKHIYAYVWGKAFDVEYLFFLDSYSYI